MHPPIRVRLAPSPTGKFHIGTARTALFNYLFAKRFGGEFIVRMEDTDRERSHSDFTKDIVDGLRWLGLDFDEGPDGGGKFGPYFQSERLDQYQHYVKVLLEEKKAYRCYCTPAELEAERQAQQAKKQAPKYSGKCRNLTAEQIAEYEKAGRPSAVRFVGESKTVEFTDLLKGPVSFDLGLFGDFTIMRSDGMPLFVLAVVVDDYLMQISHVLRGEEHLPNAAKHIAIAEALGFTVPQFGHFPLILNADRSKMSKRKNPVSITDDYRAKGYLPEAIVNFIALLGWAPGNDQEIFSLKELTEVFDLDRVGKSAAIFDTQKLLWMNGYYIRHLSVDELAERVMPFITEGDLKEKIITNGHFFHQMMALTQERLKTLAETEELIRFFYHPPACNAELLIAKKSDAATAKRSLEAAKAVLSDAADFTGATTETLLRGAAEQQDIKAGELLWTLRVALSGLAASPGVFELLEVFDKPESLKRIDRALRMFE